MQQTKAGLPHYDDNPCDFEQWHFVVMCKHDLVHWRQAVQNLTGRREVPHPVDPVPGRRMVHHVYDPGTGRQTLKDDLVPGHLGRSPLIIDDEDDEAELTRQHRGQRLSSVWNAGMQVRVVDDELDPEPCYAEWLAARNDSVSVDILTHAVAEPEMDDGLAMEESKTIVLVVALFLWYVEVVHAMLVLVFTMGLTTFIEWVDPEVYDVTCWAKSYTRMGTTDSDERDHCYAFHPDGTEKWLPPLQEGTWSGTSSVQRGARPAASLKAGWRSRSREASSLPHR